MGSLPLTLCTGLLAVTVLTPAAHAADAGGISVSPSFPAPGTDISLRLSGCTETTATAVSAAFVADVRLTGTDGTLVGESRIRSTLPAGPYDVKVTCGSAERKVPLTVVAQSQSRPGHPTTPASPVAPVHAGGGGTTRLATAEDDAGAAGPGTGHAVTGLVLVGVAAVTVVLLGSRRSRRTG